MLRSLLAALLLAPPLSAQVVSLKTSVPVLTGAPGAAAFQAPALNAALPVPPLSASLTPSVIPAIAPALVAAPAASVPQAVAPLKAAVGAFAEGAPAIPGALTGLFDGAASVGEPAGPSSAAAEPVRAFQSIKQLKVGSYNVLNLFEKVGKHVPDPENPGKLKKISEAAPKAEWSLREQGKIILENDLDVVTLAEVENIAALRDFNDNYLGGKYRVFLVEGNDERGIDVAFLVKKDLPFEIEQRSHKEETWLDPVFGGGPTKLFSRDLTSLVVRAPGKTEPLFVLFGTHFKSKRDRDGRDPESNILRAAQVQRSAEIIARYRAEFGANTPIMLAGDFNGEVGKAGEFRPLFEAAGLIDSFDASPNPASEKDRVTHTYHPRGGPAHQGQMDAVLVSKGLRAAVKKAEAYRYKNADGTVRPIPSTYEERSRNPSDHFPVIVTLDFAPFRRSATPARLFADSARTWLASSGAAFDAKNAEWAAWTENPGAVSAQTRENLRDIRSLIDRLQLAKLVFAREAAAIPATGELTPEAVRGLYDAWDRLRDAGNDAMVIIEDSAKTGLIANRDQNTLPNPGGFDLFLAPGLAVDWDAARELNEALR